MSSVDVPWLAKQALALIAQQYRQQGSEQQTRNGEA